MPVAFVLLSLEGAGVPMSERRLEFGETIYGRGDPDRHLYFLVEGVVKLYKGYRGRKEAIVTLLEEGNVFGEPAPRSEGVHRTPPKRPPLAGSPQWARRPWSSTFGAIPGAP
jgi:CRP-like cAMP-binding protein